jgi:hypothetical protein
MASLKAGVRKVLTKPITKEQFFEAVRECRLSTEGISDGY